MESKYKFEDLMKERHSTRTFLPKEIPEEILSKIIQASLYTPSWCNSQPWNVYVVSGKPLEEIKKEWISKNEKGIKGYSDTSTQKRIFRSLPKKYGRRFKSISRSNKRP